jgi:hypothetical protein
MDVGKAARGDDRTAGARREDGVGADAAAADAGLEDDLLTRLDRVVALARRRNEPAHHGELLDELRGLIRQAEKLRPPPTKTEEEVVERPARRLHGT